MNKTNIFIEKAKKIHGDIYDYSGIIYIDAHTPINIKCIEHDKITKQRPGKHLIMKKHLCKIGTSEFIEKSKTIYGNIYNYDDTIYVNYDSSVKIKCIKHENIFSQTPHSHLTNHQGCEKCHSESSSMKLVSTKDIFVEKSIKKHGDKYDYSLVEYINSREKVKIICKIHKIFELEPTHHIMGVGCSKCSSTHKSTTEEFIAKAKKIHDDKYDYSLTNYTKNNIPVNIKCIYHDKIFLQRPSDHLQGSGCYDCNKKKASDKLRSTKEEFKEKANKIHDDKYNYDEVEYVRNDIKVKIKCIKHNEIFEQTPQNHLAGKGCKKCMKNNYSKKQILWLEYEANKNNINIQHAENGGEFIIDNYQVDGYCKETNTCFEFDGNMYHGNPRMYKENDIHPLNGKKMGDLYNTTIKKEQYIKDKGYKLVVMWEDEWDKIYKTIHANIKK